MTASRSEEFFIDAFSLYDGDAQPLHYATDRDDLPMKRGEDHAALMIRLDVDGQHDAVSVDLNQSDPLDVLERSIEALQRVHAKLERTSEGQRSGRCMARGGWGRCKLRTGHEVDCDHLFPTEEEWTAEQEALGKRYPRSA